MVLLPGWFLITLDDGFFEVDTSGGVRGLDVLDIDLVSFFEFTEVDSFSGVGSLTSISWA